MDIENSTNTVDLATELTIAWLSNPNTRVSADEVPDFLKSMHAAVGALGQDSEQVVPDQEAPQHVAAVSARKSLASPDHIISMIDGKPYRTLRRHLATHGLTPEEYRSRYGLRSDYPMVAPTYSEQRRAMAQRIGLGRKPRPVASPPAAEAAAPQSKPKRGRAKTATA